MRNEKGDSAHLRSIGAQMHAITFSDCDVKDKDPVPLMLRASSGYVDKDATLFADLKDKTVVTDAKLKEAIQKLNFKGPNGETVTTVPLDPMKPNGPKVSILDQQLAPVRFGVPNVRYNQK